MELTENQQKILMDMLRAFSGKNYTVIVISPDYSSMSSVITDDMDIKGIARNLEKHLNDWESKRNG